MEAVEFPFLLILGVLASVNGAPLATCHESLPERLCNDVTKVDPWCPLAKNILKKICDFQENGGYQVPNDIQPLDPDGIAKFCHNKTLIDVLDGPVLSKTDSDECTTTCNTSLACSVTLTAVQFYLSLNKSSMAQVAHSTKNSTNLDQSSLSKGSTIGKEMYSKSTNVISAEEIQVPDVDNIPDLSSEGTKQNSSTSPTNTSSQILTSSIGKIANESKILDSKVSNSSSSPSTAFPKAEQTNLKLEDALPVDATPKPVSNISVTPEVHQKTESDLDTKVISPLDGGVSKPDLSPPKQENVNDDNSPGGADVYKSDLDGFEAPPEEDPGIEEDSPVAEDKPIFGTDPLKNNIDKEHTGFENEKPLKPRYSEVPNHGDPYIIQESSDSGYFNYLFSLLALTLLGFIVFHNKKRLIALFLEGRRPNSGGRGGRRRSGSGAPPTYKKLENNFD